MTKLEQKNIELANEVSIVEVLIKIGIEVPANAYEGGNKKLYCPFGLFYHSDNGNTKAMRVYPESNTCYCFSCSKRYTPVALVAVVNDCSWANAAHKILEDFNIKSKSLKQRWQEANTEFIAELDTSALADALKMYCSGIDPSWQSNQLNDDVSELLNNCLELLDLVKSDEDAYKWLTTCKKTMNRKLNDLHS